MKAVQVRAQDRRALTRERQRRARAATQVMRERFPQFASVRIEFDFSDTAPFTPAPQTTVLHPPARAYFYFPCPFTDCDGEFDLSEAVATLAREGGPQNCGQLRCGGQRGSDRPRMLACTLVADYRVDAEFT